MFLKLFLLFTVGPIIELYLLIRLGAWIGALPTIAIVLITGALGAYLARLEGFRVWFKIQEEASFGRFPGPELIDGLLILCAGVVLVTPGLITDVLGFLCLIPITRIPIRNWAARRLKRMVEDGNIHVTGFMS